MKSKKKFLILFAKAILPLYKLVIGLEAKIRRNHFYVQILMRMRLAYLLKPIHASMQLLASGGRERFNVLIFHFNIFLFKLGFIKLIHIQQKIIEQFKDYNVLMFNLFKPNYLKMR